MAINVCRLNPKWFAQHVAEVHKDKELIPDSSGKNRRKRALVELLNTQNPLPLVNVDVTADRAVREN